jgi:hypothetical protein
MKSMKIKRQEIVKIIFLFLLIGFISVPEIIAQRWKMRRYEVGIGFGSVQVFGDIGGTADKENWFGLKDISLDETRPAFSLDARYKINTFLSTKANLDLGFGKGQDFGSRNDRGRSYKTTLIEFSGQVEHYFLVEEKRYRSAAMYSKRGMLNNYSTISAYTFLGAGLIYANAHPSPGTAEVLPVDDYRPGTHLAPVIPFGLGVKYVIDDKTYLGVELGYRWPLSDYLDGYKQTAASQHNDVYYFFLLSLNYRLKTTRRNIPAFLDPRYRKFGY